MKIKRLIIVIPVTHCWFFFFTNLPDADKMWPDWNNMLNLYLSSTRNGTRSHLQKFDENQDGVKNHPSVLDTLYNDFKQSYSDPYVCKLCFWWAVAMGGYLQVSANVSNIEVVRVRRTTLVNLPLRGVLLCVSGVRVHKRIVHIRVGRKPRHRVHTVQRRGGISKHAIGLVNISKERHFFVGRKKRRAVWWIKTNRFLCAPTNTFGNFVIVEYSKYASNGVRQNDSELVGGDTVLHFVGNVSNDKKIFGIFASDYVSLNVQPFKPYTSRAKTRTARDI